MLLVAVTADIVVMVGAVIKAPHALNMLAQVVNCVVVVRVPTERRLKQLLNKLVKLVTLLRSRSGTVCKLEQFENICRPLVTLAKLNCGMVCKLLQFENMVCVSVRLLKSINGTVRRLEHELNMLVAVLQLTML